MSVQPQGRLAKVQFAENHAPVWNGVATQVGLTTAKVGVMTTKTTKARASYAAQQAAFDAARAATLQFHTDVADLSAYVSELLKDIKSYAASTADPDTVFATAQIPAPQIPGPVGKPGTASGFKVQLLQDGALRFTFKCTNPPNAVGTLYQVQRKSAGTGGEFVFVGAAGKKQFTDTTVPMNSGPVTYRVTAVRSTASGDVAEFTVNFGTGAAGQPTASVAPQAGGAPRLAA